MIYLNEKDIQSLGIHWNELIEVIKAAIRCMAVQDYAQPKKPYLRYRDHTNRIIAMPAFVGGNIDRAGIKWIAGFPGNIVRGLPRAHSVIILNNAETGEPQGIINTALLSIIRTVSVSAFLIEQYCQARPRETYTAGITGWGPIGRNHASMLADLLGPALEMITVYDIRGIDSTAIPGTFREKMNIAENWEEAYVDADIFITCTVAKAPYIDKPPKKGSLQLNVSLRDYKKEIYEWIKDSIIVDDWDEVCREKTDIEVFHKEKGLTRSMVQTFPELHENNRIAHMQPETPILVNPMGMAVFDIAVAAYYLEKARERGIGQLLE